MKRLTILALALVLVTTTGCAWLCCDPCANAPKPTCEPYGCNPCQNK